MQQRTWLGRGLVVGGLMLAFGACGEDPPVSGGPGGGYPGDGADGGAATDSGYVPYDAGSNTGGDTAGGGNAGGGGEPVPGGECGSIEKAAEVTRGPVDIVLALDTSGSMTSHICNVSKNLTSFADAVGKDSRVVANYQIGPDLFFQFAFLCQKDDPLAGTALAMDANRYLRVNTKVDSHNALRVLLDRFDGYKSFLRAGSPTHFIVVTDDSSNTPAAQFKSQMEQKLGHPFYFHSIAMLDNGCNGESIGQDYIALSDQTGGKKLSICSQDWTALFKELEAAVIASAPLPCEFDLPAPPPGETLNASKVSVVFEPPSAAKAPFPKASNQAACGDKAGWHYDDEAAPKQIKFCPAACTQVRAGGKLSIAFGCEPPILL